MINVAGENVYPKEVEDVLLRHPNLGTSPWFPPARREGAVRGVRGRARRKTTEELSFFLERGAPYAHPRRVFFLDRLPLGGTGKLDRTALKRQAATLPPIESQR
jgi:acyl-CoA synthetase (AMP-forming)/AMP-acid ligase II